MKSRKTTKYPRKSEELELIREFLSLMAEFVTCEYSTDTIEGDAIYWELFVN